MVMPGLFLEKCQKIAKQIRAVLGLLAAPTNRKTHINLNKSI